VRQFHQGDFRLASVAYLGEAIEAFGKRTGRFRVLALVAI